MRPVLQQPGMQAVNETGTSTHFDAHLFQPPLLEEAAAAAEHHAHCRILCLQERRNKAAHGLLSGRKRYCDYTILPSSTCPPDQMKSRDSLQSERSIPKTGTTTALQRKEIKAKATMSAEHIATRGVRRLRLRTVAPPRPYFGAIIGLLLRGAVQCAVQSDAVDAVRRAHRRRL